MAGGMESAPCVNVAAYCWFAVSRPTVLGVLEVGEGRCMVPRETALFFSFPSSIDVTADEGLLAS